MEELEIAIPMDKSKSLTSTKTGEIIYFVDKKYGMKNGLMDMMIFSSIHPIYTDMCEIKGNIIRV
jgi:hypothetical protein